MIKINEVHKRFGNIEVLKGVSFEVNKGEVVCLIGPSGSGKSTILRCINGLETYEEGDIHLLDQRVNSRDKRINDLRRQIGMVFQRFNLFPHRSVLENVMEGPIHVNGESRAVAEKRSKDLLALVGLADKINAWPAQLSGGQQQRVAIARTLALQPQAILFVEPSSALDPELVGEVLQVMRTLASEGMTMVVVTHEMQFAREVADRVCFLHGGLIVEQGPADRILGNPQEPRTQDFLKRVLGTATATAAHCENCRCVR